MYNWAVNFLQRVWTYLTKPLNGCPPAITIFEYFLVKLTFFSINIHWRRKWYLTSSLGKTLVCDSYVHLVSKRSRFNMSIQRVKNWTHPFWLLHDYFSFGIGIKTLQHLTVLQRTCLYLHSVGNPLFSCCKSGQNLLLDKGYEYQKQKFIIWQDSTKLPTSATRKWRQMEATEQIISKL